MTLSVICQKSRENKKSVESILKYVGIVDYEILDPQYHDLSKPFSVALILGNPIEVTATKTFKLELPDPNKTKKEKLLYIDKIKKIKEYIEILNDRTSIKRDDVPEIKGLLEYLNGQLGKVVELKLKDRRRVGVYPDNQKLKGLYDLEYHASSIVNLAQLFTVFDATEINIKEI